MDSHSCTIIFPNTQEDLDQNEEFVIVEEDDTLEKILLHDYRRFYEIPGLYEEVLYNRLACCSPKVLCEFMSKAMNDRGVEDEPLRVLDFGAGNGVAGEHFKEIVGCDTLVGVDILPEAKEAALRDRPNLYDDYLVADFTDLDSSEKSKLEEFNFNTLLTVAALGYDHIGTQAFLNAFDMVADGAWLAFNIRDRFLSDKDASGFRDTVRELVGERMQVHRSERYIHRMSINDEPLYYIGIIGQKST